jgi:hypothetical protein
MDHVDRQARLAQPPLDTGSQPPIILYQKDPHTWSMEDKSKRSLKALERSLLVQVQTHGAT